MFQPEFLVFPNFRSIFHAKIYDMFEKEHISYYYYFPNMFSSGINMRVWPNFPMLAQRSFSVSSASKLKKLHYQKPGKTCCQCWTQEKIIRTLGRNSNCPKSVCSFRKEAYALLPFNRGTVNEDIIFHDNMEGVEDKLTH